MNLFETEMDVINFMMPDFMVSFIHTYRKHPCLWNVKSPDYSDPIKKENALQELVERSKHMLPGVNVKFIKKMIDYIRNNFTNELRKVKDAVVSKTIYIPKIWYYKHLGFLADQEESRESKSNTDTSEDEENNNNSDESETEDKTDDSDSTISTAPRFLLNIRKSYVKRQKIDVAENQKTALLTKAVATLDKSEDEFDAFGKTIAAKMRKMKNSQTIYADKLINDVLFYGLNDNLSYYTHVTNSSHQTLDNRVPPTNTGH